MKSSSERMLVYALWNFLFYESGYITFIEHCEMLLMHLYILAYTITFSFIIRIESFNHFCGCRHRCV